MLLPKVVEALVVPIVVRLRLAQEPSESGVVYDFTSAQTLADPVTGP
ncbi:MAG: hypothetical protein OXC31_13245 [Spirochaetaceae bacterium]|nr:hypothetical protein [Spirochaetaceae bacterium]